MNLIVLFIISRCKLKFYTIRMSEILLWLRYLLWCEYAGSSLEVKIETDSNDAMEIKTEADSNDITECSHVDHSSTGTVCLLSDIYWVLIACLLLLLCVS